MTWAMAASGTPSFSALANTVISLFYYLRVIGPVYFGTSAKTPAVLGTWSAAATLWAGILLLALGLVAGPVLSAWEDITLLP